jgi:DNA polymerase I
MAASSVAKELNELFELLDELEYECEEPIAQEIAQMIEKSIAKAGEYLKIKVPLVGEGKVGLNWKETH